MTKSATRPDRGQCPDGVLPEPNTRRFIARGNCSNTATTKRLALADSAGNVLGGFRLQLKLGYTRRITFDRSRHPTSPGDTGSGSDGLTSALGFSGAKGLTKLEAAAAGRHDARPQTRGATHMAESPLAVYQAHLDKGELAYQWSRRRGRAVFYPRVVCPYSGSTELEWRVARARHGLRDDRDPRVPGRRLQHRPDRLRRGLSHDGPGRGDRPDGGQDRHAGQIPRPSGRAATSRPTRSSPRREARHERPCSAAARRSSAPRKAISARSAPGFNVIDLMAQGITRALDDCGLGAEGCRRPDLRRRRRAAPRPSTSANISASRRAYIDSTIIGGSSFMFHVGHAMAAIQLGLCEVAVIAYGSTQRSIGRQNASVREINPYETPYRPFLPSTAYALAASRHMHEFGTTREQMAEVAVAARQWALKNPVAWEKKPLTVDEVLNARMVSYPFTVRDICLVTDGGGAIVLTTPGARQIAEEAAGLCARPGRVHHPRQYLEHARPDRDRRARKRAAGLCDGRARGQGHRRRRALRRVHDQHDPVPRRPRLLQEGRRRRALSRAAASRRAAACRSTPTAAASPTATPACTACSC